MIASCSCSEKEGYPAEDECQNKDPTPTKIFLTTHHLPTTESSSKSSRRSTTTHHLPTTESSSKSSRRSTTIAKSSSPPRRTYKMSTVKLSSSVITTKSIKPTTITPKAIKSREKSSALLLKEATTHKHHTSNRPRQTTKLITPTTTSSNTHSLPDNYTGISVYSRSYIMRRDASLKRPTRIIDTIKGTLPGEFSPHFIFIAFISSLLFGLLCQRFVFIASALKFTVYLEIFHTSERLNCSSINNLFPKN